MITLLSILKTAILYYNFDSEFTKVSLKKILFCFRIYTRAIQKVAHYCGGVGVASTLLYGWT